MAEPGEGGKRHKCMRFFCKIIHIIDIFLGVLLLTYGIMISVTFPMAGPPAFFIAYGGTVLTSVILSFLGKRIIWCMRIGIWLGGLLALPIAIFDIFTAFYFHFGKETWMSWANNNQEALYLNTESIEGLGKASLPIFIVGLVMSFLELVRCYFSYKIWRNMLRMDSEIEESSFSDPLLHPSDQYSRL
mmetsp:Transcript_14646/g.21645  ORF Transcript_14646/g.21645 Transcript_14646/m.21645 type:complete len:188 (+) Transcript_14646:108-671(+)